MKKHLDITKLSFEIAMRLLKKTDDVIGTTPPRTNPSVHEETPTHYQTLIQEDAYAINLWFILLMPPTYGLFFLMWLGLFLSNNEFPSSPYDWIGMHVTIQKNSHNSIL